MEEKHCRLWLIDKRQSWEIFPTERRYAVLKFVIFFNLNKQSSWIEKNFSKLRAFASLLSVHPSVRVLLI